MKPLILFSLLMAALMACNINMLNIKKNNVFKTIPQINDQTLFAGENSVDNEESSIPLDYGPWNFVPCFNELAYRVKKIEYNSETKKYRWGIEFHNGYKETINFGFEMINSYSSKLNVKTTSRMSLKSGKTGSNWYYVDDNESVQVVVDKIRFGDADNGEYRNCAY